MSEMVQKAALALVDSPLTTKGVIVANVGTASATLLNVLPDILSIVGLIIAAIAAGLLAIRHRKAGKLDDARRVGAEMQNAHDEKMHEHSAKMRDIELERVQLELDNYKAESV